MQIYGFYSNAAAARSPAAGSQSGFDAPPLEHGTGSSSLKLFRVDDEVAANRKAIAKKKLDDVKEQLRMLRFWASDPETLARLAKQLAQQLGAAAQQFAGGGSAGMPGGDGAAMGAASSAASATLAAASATAKASTDEAVNSGSEDGRDNGRTEPTSFAERAYREFSSDSSGDKADAATIAEFKALAEQLKQLLRKAEQDLRAEGDGSDADDARRASNALAASMSSLDAAGPAGATVSATTIPTSVSI